MVDGFYDEWVRKVYQCLLITNGMIQNFSGSRLMPNRLRINDSKKWSFWCLWHVNDLQITSMTLWRSEHLLRSWFRKISSNAVECIPLILICACRKWHWVWIAVWSLLWHVNDIQITSMKTMTIQTSNEVDSERSHQMLSNVHLCFRLVHARTLLVGLECSLVTVVYQGTKTFPRFRWLLQGVESWAIEFLKAYRESYRLIFGGFRYSISFESYEQKKISRFRFFDERSKKSKTPENHTT